MLLPVLSVSNIFGRLRVKLPIPFYLVSGDFHLTGPETSSPLLSRSFARGVMFRFFWALSNLACSESFTCLWAGSSNQYPLFARCPYSSPGAFASPSDRVLISCGNGDWRTFLFICERGWGRQNPCPCHSRSCKWINSWVGATCSIILDVVTFANLGFVHFKLMLKVNGTFKRYCSLLPPSSQNYIYIIFFLLNTQKYLGNGEFICTKFYQNISIFSKVSGTRTNTDEHRYIQKSICVVILTIVMRISLLLHFIG